MRVALVAVLVSLAAAAHDRPLPGPPPPDGSDNCINAASLLHAATSLEKAWGAYLAVNCRRADLADDLVAELSAIRIGPAQFIGLADQDASLVQVLLDALIQLDHAVAPELLMHLLPQWRAEVIVLLVRNPDSDAALQSLVTHPLVWAERLAVYNTLVARRATGIAARLLSEVQFRHEIFVTGPNQGLGVGGGGVGGGSAGCGATELARGFPPAGRYTLDTHAQGGDVLLADGPERVYVRRVIVPTSRRVGWSVDDSFGGHERVYIEHLATLSGLPSADVESALQGRTWVRWGGLAQYQVQVADAIAGQRDALLRMLRRLTASGVLTADERSFLHLRIRVEVTDARVHAVPALGQPKPVEIVIP